VILVRTDESGRVWPVNAPQELPESKAGRGKRQRVCFTYVLPIRILFVLGIPFFPFGAFLVLHYKIFSKMLLSNANVTK
jgi:hypothetical protein